MEWRCVTRRCLPVHLYIFYLPAVLPLIRSPLLTGNLPPQISLDSSAFLFFGTNSTTFNPTNINYHGDDPVGAQGIDLSSIPTIYNGSDGFSSGTIRLYSSLAAILVCDPHLSTSSSTVTLSANGTLSLSSASWSTPQEIGNLPYTSASNITTQALIPSVGIMDNTLIGGNLLWSSLSEALFFNQSVLTTVGTPPLALDQINANMNSYMVSASKAYADGYISFDNVSTVGVPALTEVDRLSITASKSLCIVTMALFVTEVVILLAVMKLRAKPGNTFDLENVAKAVFQYGSVDPKWRDDILRSSESAAGGDTEGAPLMVQRKHISQESISTAGQSVDGPVYAV